MPRIKQSLCFWCFKPEDPASFFREVAKIGFAAVELVPTEFLDDARAAGLVIASRGAGSLTDGLNRKENHPLIEDQIHEALEQAAQYQIPNVIVFSGSKRGISDDEGTANIVTGLRRVVPEAEAKGITLVLELLNSKVDHKDYQCDHTACGVRVCELVSSPRVKLLYDIYHMQIMEGDLIRTIRQNIAHIGHIHTAGNPGRQDLDDQQEINYPSIMRAIAEAGYTGYVGHEFRPKGAALEALRAAYALCDV